MIGLLTSIQYKLCPCYHEFYCCYDILSVTASLCFEWEIIFYFTILSYWLRLLGAGKAGTT